MDNILVYPCGSEIGLEINRAFKGFVNATLLGASAHTDHGEIVYDLYLPDIPNIYNSEFIEKLNSAINKYNIDFIFPTHDDVLLYLTKNRKVINCEIIAPDYEICKILRCKTKTYSYFGNEDFIPQEFALNKINKKYFPLFLKPNDRQGGQGTSVVYNMKELEAELTINPNRNIYEYLPGEEYSVDCYSNNKGELKFVGIRERKRIFGGISVHTVPYNDKYIQQMANIIQKKLKLKGVFFFQVKRDVHGKMKLLEIAPRIASSMALYRNIGVNFPTLAYYTAKGIDCDLLVNQYDIELDRALSNSFIINGLKYKHVYVDLDDCLIIANKVNTEIIAFLYKEINEKKKIHLISKHEKNLKKELVKHRIYKLFDEIHHIEQNEYKVDYIKHKDAIFIDNAFHERKEVFNRLHIPVFAPDAIESLLYSKHQKT